MNPTEPRDVANPSVESPTGDKPAGIEPPADTAATQPAEPTQPHRTHDEKKKRERALRDSAQAFYTHAQSKIYDILFNPNLENPPLEEGENPQLIPDEELSYTVLVRENAKGYYGFTYDDDATAPKGRRVKPTKKESNQSPAAHVVARDKARELLQVFFNEQQQRIAKLIERLETKAKEKSPDKPDNYKKQRVRNAVDPSDKGGRLDHRITGAYKSLERLRLAAVDDVLDWFRMRVNQVESQIQAITRRRSATDNIPDRLARLEKDQAIQAALQALDQDYQMIVEVTAHESIAPQDNDKKFFKGKLEAKAKAAARIREFVNRSQARMQEVLNTNRNGRNQVEAQADRLIEGLIKGSDLFMAEARRQMIGLSPEEERNFLEALNELFDDVGGAVDGKPGSAERRASINERFNTANRTFRLFEKFQDGRVQRDRLVRAAAGSEIRVNDDYTPQNVDELFARAKQDAIVLGEIRQMMRRTFAIMGPKFANAVRAELKGMPNADKKEGVIYMNGLLSKTQERVIKELMADEAFKTSLGERKVQELRFSNEADRPIILQIRTKVFEVLNLGEDLDKPNLEVIPTLMEAPADSETVAAETEAAREEQEPILQPIIAGEVKAEVLEQAFSGTTPGDFAKLIKGKLKEIRDLTGSSPLRDTIIKSFDLAIPARITNPVEVVQQAVQKIDAIRDAFAQLQKTFGKDWALDAGIVQTDPANPRQKLANDELLSAALQRFADIDDFIEALMLDTVPTAQEQLLGKIPVDVTSRLDRLDLAKDQQLAIMLYALPRTSAERATDSVHPATALKRVANCLSLGTLRGVALLKDRKFIKIEDEASGDWSYDAATIVAVMGDKKFDQAA